MPGPRASTTYKKKDGTLAFDRVQGTVAWTPIVPPGAPALVTIAVPDITNLQQTPASNPKVALRIIVQAAGASEPENHVFNFTSTASARAEQEAITEALRTAISIVKAGTTLPTAAAGETDATNDPAGHSAAITFAQSATSSASAAAAAESWYDEQKLKSNVELQQSLLRADHNLRQLFEESLREKPEGISNSQFATQFWGTRLHLLRAHAIDKSQAQATYNVLSEVKPKMVDGAPLINLSKDQIQLIFAQHPLVKRVYNESVPRLSEAEFWSRFFVSRLFKKLKGERITDSDSTDSVLDRYLTGEADREEAEATRRLAAADGHVPLYIDLEGNEQNHSQRKGNQPDFTMRPNAVDKVPILRVLNAMSEKMLANVAPADGDPHAPIGMDEETFNSLRLRDLQAAEGDDRVILNIKDHGSLFGVSDDAQISPEARAYAQHDPTQVLSKLRAGINPQSDRKTPASAGGIDLAAAIGLDVTAIDADSDSDSEIEQDSGNSGSTKLQKSSTAKVPRLGSRAALNAATKQISDILTQLRTHLGASAAPDNPANLSPSVSTSLALAHNTTVEFLHYFWTLFLGSDSSNGGHSSSADRDLPSLLSTLSNSLIRLSAVADEAEKERAVRLMERKRQAVELAQRTGRKRRVDDSLESIGGGKVDVEALVAPTVRAIQFAKTSFETAFNEQTLKAGAQGES